MSSEYQICTRCVMDTTDSNIQFDDDGVCNHCTSYLAKKDILLLPKKERRERLEQTLAEIQEWGAGKEYDCIAGVSGGVDSTYMVYKAKELGLRPLAVHLDNGWNSRLAVTNIERVLNKLDVDLYTHVIDWEEFKDLQKSYFYASVVDIEVPTDHAIIAIIFDAARQHGIKYILRGSNFATEGIMAKSWVWNKNDLKNLEDIHRTYGTRPLKTFPKLGLFRRLYLEKLRGITRIPLLNLMDYVRQDAKEFLISQLGWEDYGGKHHESLFTKFYQSYILPTKFGIDKRKAHLSTMICSGQTTRDKALETLKQPLYDERELRRDTSYVLKKFGWTEQEFEEIMSTPVRQHDEFKTDSRLRRMLSRL